MSRCLLYPLISNALTNMAVALASPNSRMFETPRSVFAASTASATRSASLEQVAWTLHALPFANQQKESFNARLKAEGDDNSTNLYISNLPRELDENVSRRNPPSELAATDTTCPDADCGLRPVPHHLEQDSPRFHGQQPRCGLRPVSPRSQTSSRPGRMLTWLPASSLERFVRRLFVASTTSRSAARRI